MISVFVIVVTYNGKQWYDRCFDSLRHSTLPISIIAVDNASADDSVSYIKEHYPEIILIENKSNLGFGRANNIGMRYALDNNCDYVFLLNQDAWIESDTLKELVSVHQSHKEYGLLSPMHLNIDKTGLVMKYFCMQSCNEKLITDLYFNRLSDIYETYYIHAAAWMLPRNTLQTIGGFDPIFFHYAEDDDYLNRLIFHGIKIGVCPGAQIIHDHHDYPVNPTSIRYHHNQTLLAEYMDLSHPFHCGSYLHSYSRRLLRNLLRPKARRNNGIFQDIRFLLKNAKAIKSHRKQNSELGETWLVF